MHRDLKKRIRSQFILATSAVALLFALAPVCATGQEEAAEMDEATLERVGKAAVERAAKDVEQYGWHFVAVPGEDSAPGFVFTIGLWRTYEHPEIILFAPSQDPKGMAGRLAAVARRVAGGERFEINKSYDGLFGRFSGEFRRVDHHWYVDYLGTAAAYYESFEFPSIQLFWPDSEGRFPWSGEFPQELLRYQPALYVIGGSHAEQ